MGGSGGGGGGTTVYYSWAPPSGTIVVLKLSNPNNETLTDYQVKVDALPIKDCIGLKFKITTNDGQTEVPYCFERQNGECSATFCDSSDPTCSDPYDENFWTGNIWVKVPEIPANGETTLIVQPDTAYHAVSGDQVFDFYDDFSGSELDGWTVSSWVSYTLSNGTLILAPSVSNDNLGGISKSTGFGISGLLNKIYEVRAKPEGNLWPVNIRIGDANPEGYTDGTYAQLQRTTYLGKTYALNIRHEGNVVSSADIGTDFNNRWLTLSYILLSDSQIAKAEIEGLGTFTTTSGNYTGYANDNIGLFIHVQGGSSAKNGL
jgi:hypothetical protein